MNSKKSYIPSFTPTDYGDFFDRSRSPLDIAAAVTKSSSILSRNIWHKRLAIIGEEQFRYELFLFWCDLRAGESVRNRARAFTARLNKTIKAAENR